MAKIDAIRSGQRIRQARLLADYMTQVQFAEKYGISINTLKSWELGINSLSKAGAEKLSKAFIDAGINCSAEWLLYGTGPFTLLEGLSDNLRTLETNALPIDIEQYSKAIDKEIAVFKTIPNAEVVIVNDNGMEPFYFVGDYVGGIKFFPDQFKENFKPCHCIVQTSNNITLVRCVQPALTRIGFNIICTNLNTNTDLSQNEVNLNYIAPIIWHRKRKLF